MNRLWVWLTAAFALVVLITVGAIAFLVIQTTNTEFRQYVTHSGMRASGTGIQKLVDYYQETGSWQGVDELLAQSVLVSGSPVMPGMANTPWRQPLEPRPGMPGRRLDVLLADAGKRIVFDSTGQDVGRRLTRTETSRALPITPTDSDGADQETIGYLLISMPGGTDPLGRLERQFLDRMRSLLFTGAALAVCVALILGAFLSRSMTAPLQRLAAAARAVATRDFSRRVRVEGSAELVEVAEAFNDMVSALEQSEQQRQNMVADVAHELRTPLSVLQGNLRAILDDVYALDKAEISRLYDETRLLSRLVDDLRELALADAGQLRLHLRPTDVAQVVISTVESLALAAEAEEVHLTAKLPGDLPLVQVDPDRVAQILRNLLVNALRHTPPGGSVTVTAALRNKTVEIAVTDSGEGIAAEDLPHVFERFWRADPARARTTASGTGLGLAVAQSLVEAQGGRIWAESEPGRGSTFCVALPQSS